MNHDTEHTPPATDTPLTFHIQQARQNLTRTGDRWPTHRAKARRRNRRTGH